MVHEKISKIKPHRRPRRPESVVTDSPELVNGICGLQDATRPWKMTDKLLSPLHSPSAQTCPCRAPSCRGAGARKLTATTPRPPPSAHHPLHQPCQARGSQPGWAGPIVDWGGGGGGGWIGGEEPGGGRMGTHQRLGKPFPANMKELTHPRTGKSWRLCVNLRR